MSLVRMARKPFLVLMGAIIAVLVAAAIPPIWYANWTAAVPGVLIAALVVSLLWPSVGLHGYFAYRPPQLIFTLTMELWILLGGVALRAPSSLLAQDAWFQAFLVTFFLWTSSNSLPWMVGDYRSGVSLRPDLIFGGGSYLVRGEIFVALGIELLTSPRIAHPIWNWWGVTAEVAAMIILVALRGILKVHMRRARLLGLDTWMGRRGLRLGVWVKESFLFAALFVVVYAFYNMYTGQVPLTWSVSHPQLWGLAWLALAYVLLAPVRGGYKTRLAEPATIRQELVKGILLWLGFLTLIYGLILLFRGNWAGIACCSYYNFWWGIWTSVLGFLMVVPLRIITLREEFRGTITMMMGTLADLPVAECHALLLHAAYNDHKGVTAAFNTNVLTRLNRELGADFQLERFRHYAPYNPVAQRVEMHLVSCDAQTVHVGDVAYSFGRGESIWTESSYKYSLRAFTQLAREAGFTVAQIWMDPQQLFSVQYLVAQ